MTSTERDSIPYLYEHRDANETKQNSVSNISAEQLHITYVTNVYPMFYLTKAALPYLMPGSTIVNTASITAYTPMKRAGQPFELAPAYVLLASDDSSYVTGSVPLEPDHKSNANRIGGTSNFKVWLYKRNAIVYSHMPIKKKKWVSSSRGFCPKKHIDKNIFMWYNNYFFIVIYPPKW